MAQRLDDALRAEGALIALVPVAPVAVPTVATAPDLDAELEAIELIRRVEASDVGDGTLSRLEVAADRMATSYASTPPAELLPRRVASARLDLALALLAADKPDEAGAEALSAVTSGRIVPSNWWRATEVLTGVERAGVPEAQELREVCRAFRPMSRELTS